MARNRLAQAATAASDGDLETLKHLLTSFPEVLTARGSGGRTLLDLACRAATGDIAIPPKPGTPEQHAAVDLILNAGADPSRCGQTQLDAAPHRSHGRSRGPCPTAHRRRRFRRIGSTRQGWRIAALLRAVYAKAYMGEVLIPIYPDNLRTAAALGNGVDRFFDGAALTPDAYRGLDFYAPEFFPICERKRNRQEVLDEALSWAARNNQCDSMAGLVARGADLNANAFRGTPLLWACYSDRVEAAAWLLDHGADPDLRHDWGGEGHGVNAVAMHLAAQYNCVGCLNLLLDRGADSTVVDGAYHGTPKEWAEFHGSADAVEILNRRVG